MYKRQGLHWIDLGISGLNSKAKTMDDAVHNAAPRSVGEPLPAPEIHPDDLKLMIEWMKTQELDEVGNELVEEAQDLIHA